MKGVTTLICQKKEKLDKLGHFELFLAEMKIRSSLQKTVNLPKEQDVKEQLQEWILKLLKARPFRSHLKYCFTVMERPSL